MLCDTKLFDSGEFRVQKIRERISRSPLSNELKLGTIYNSWRRTTTPAMKEGMKQRVRVAIWNPTHHAYCG